MTNLKSQLITDSLKRFDDKYNSFELTEPIYKQAAENLRNFLTQELSLAMQKIEEETRKEDLKQKLSELPRKFFEDEDHAVGGYISKKDLFDLLTTPTI